MRGLRHRALTGKEANGLNIAVILQGWFVAFVAMFVFSIILTIISVLSTWEETPRALNSFNYLSVLFGGIYVGLRCHRKIWLNGAIVGIGYLLILTWIQGDFSLMLHGLWIQRLVLVGVVGMLGGIIGAIFS